MMTRWLSVAVGIIAVSSITLSGCPGVQLGGGPLNEPPPSSGYATIISSAQFNGENGGSDSGNAVLYSTTAGTFIVRLSGISAPNENGLQVHVFAGGANVFRQALRSISGNQNYEFAIATPFSWDYVAIYSTRFNFDYAKAHF
jgi:hypothetical protein